MSDHATENTPAVPPAKYLSYEERRDIEQVDEILADVVGRFGGPAALAGAALFEQWREVGGAEWGVRATPVAIRDGVLTVAVASGADAAVAKYDEAAIRARIQARFGPDLVRSIRFRVERAAR